jgi:hypothetical protein
MGGEGDAAGDILTGAIVGGTVEGAVNAGGKRDPEAHGTCRNCRATLNGAYCSACGQRAHLHSSLFSLGHDILHGVFHFEGKMWRTMPELFFHPGRLTRRYIDGERAKFVSPMALYLFTVFLMFGVFSFTTGDVFDDAIDSNTVTNWKIGNAAAIDATQEKIDALDEQLADEDLPAQQRAALERKRTELNSAHQALQAVQKGDWDALKGIQKEQDGSAQTEPADDDELHTDVNVSWPALERRLKHGATQVKDNPSLAFYKMKIASYKYSWALIPLSVPFLWLLFFWRRDIHLYDHAIFITYSISFMMLFVVALSLAATFGVSAAIWGTALGIIPPIHLYKQLRGAYGLSRFGSWLRLFLLTIAIFIVLVIFFTLLVLIGIIS